MARITGDVPQDPESQFRGLRVTIQAFLPELEQGGRLVLARLLAALALLERQREHWSADLDDHMSGAGSTGLKSHERLGAAACQRLRIIPPKKTTHGRRSSDLRNWGPKLLRLLDGMGMSAMEPDARHLAIDAAQQPLGDAVRDLLEHQPMVVRSRNRSVAAIVGEIIELAEERDRSGEVSQYLVGAKLGVRLDVPITPIGANVADRRKWELSQERLGDFQIASTVVEVAMGRPDDKHIDQVAGILDATSYEIWLIVRSDRREQWLKELADGEVDLNRVVVIGLNEFIGQNVGEMGGLDRPATLERFRRVIADYNENWVKVLAHDGLRIELTD